MQVPKKFTRVFIQLMNVRHRTTAANQIAGHDVPKHHVAHGSLDGITTSVVLIPAESVVRAKARYHLHNTLFTYVVENLSYDGIIADLVPLGRTHDRSMQRYAIAGEYEHAARTLLKLDAPLYILERFCRAGADQITCGAVTESPLSTQGTGRAPESHKLFNGSYHYVSVTVPRRGHLRADNFAPGWAHAKVTGACTVEQVIGMAPPPGEWPPVQQRDPWRSTLRVNAVAPVVVRDGRPKLEPHEAGLEFARRGRPSSGDVARAVDEAAVA